MSVRPLSKELQDVASRELNEDPKRLQKDLDYIKEWLAKQPHINARLDDQFLVAFLRGSKFSLERTKEKLEMYHTLKTVTPEIYENRDPFSPEIQKLLSLGVMLPLTNTTTSLVRHYTLVRNGIVDQQNISQAEFFKLGTMILEILMIEDDNFIIGGTYLIQDMAGISMSYSLSISPSFVKKGMMCFQQGYPQRLKALIFFNISSIFEAIHKIFRPFLSEKFKQRMQLYSSLEEMCKRVPQEILPEEYGGQGGKLEELAAYWKTKVESYRDWFLEDVKYRTDESKRVGKPKTSESVFGLEGSFRQLSFD